MLVNVDDLVNGLPEVLQSLEGRPHIILVYNIDKVSIPLLLWLSLYRFLPLNLYVVRWLRQFILCSFRLP